MFFKNYDDQTDIEKTYIGIYKYITSCVGEMQDILSAIERVDKPSLDIIKEGGMFSEAMGRSILKEEFERKVKLVREAFDKIM